MPPFLARLELVILAAILLSDFAIVFGIAYSAGMGKPRFKIREHYFVAWICSGILAFPFLTFGRTPYVFSYMKWFMRVASGCLFFLLSGISAGCLLGGLLFRRGTPKNQEAK
ncbi:MAG: hypothetical protein ACRD50_16035 [Candidatus Acidiferrales bacterium]